MAADVVGVEWERFEPWFAGKWEPGQHVAIISPTGSGKTTVLCHILPRRKFALAFDPKGGDETLDTLRWPRLEAWPPRQRVYEDMAEGKPAQFLVGPRVQRLEDRQRLKAVQLQALKGVFNDGGWTVAVDEFQLLSDKRMMDLGVAVEELLISARSKAVSVVTLFQAPRWVPRAAADQSSWIFCALTRDTDVVDRMAEILGRPRPEVRGAVEGLGARPYSWLIAPGNPRDPLIVTVPKKATAPK